MQLMILGDESPRLLRLASQFLLDVAQVQEAELKNGGPLMPAEPSEPVNEAPLTFKGAPVVLDAPDRPEPVPFVPVPPPPPVEVPTAPAPTTPITTSVASTAPSAASPQLDKRGFPHDARIHSKEPKLNADGTWRARRNLDNAELERVEAELRAQGYGPQAPDVPRPGNTVTVHVGPGVASVPVTVPLPPPAPVVAAPDAPAAAPAQVMVPPPPPVAAPVSTSAFQVLMQRVSRNAQGVCSNAAIGPTWAKVGVKGWADFFQRPDLIPAMTAELDALGAAP